MENRFWTTHRVMSWCTMLVVFEGKRKLRLMPGAMLEAHRWGLEPHEAHDFLVRMPAREVLRLASKNNSNVTLELQ